MLMNRHVVHGLILWNREPSGFRIEKYSSPSCKERIIRNHVLVSSHRFISENGFSRPSLQKALNMKFESKTVNCPNKDCQVHIIFNLNSRLYVELDVTR